MCKAKEGELYKSYLIEGRLFEIRYGYYSEAEREKWHPTPIFPDFLREPLYTADGSPFVTAEQDSCRYFTVKPTSSGEGWCDDCRYYEHAAEIIGICRCNERKRIAHIK